MPIMRRGPLDLYPAGRVLRDAAAQRLDGSIEFFSDRPMTVYFDEGEVYAAGTGVAGEGAVADEAIGHDDGALVRAETVARIVDALCSIGGWYYHDPMGRHPWRGWWAWDIDELLAEARASSPEATAAFVLANQRIHMAETRDEPITLGPDAWAVVATLTSWAAAEEIRTRLGWNPARLLKALTQLNGQGALEANPDQNRKPVRSAAQPVT